jgi:NADH-quinone oxidoreductase subunit L
MEVPTLVWMALGIVALPMSSYFILSAVGNRLPRQGDWLSTGAIFGSFLLACGIFAEFWGASSPTWVVQYSWTWMDLSSLASEWKLQVGVRLDNISAIMLLMVTLCATLIHLFSTGYMRDHHGKPEDGYRYTSFFSYLSLFTSAMLGLVISDNLFTLFMAWELMGLCSYLLIGFYRHKPSAANASLKAFMTTRVGDTGLFIGMLALFALIGSFRFEDIYAAIDAGAFDGQLWGISAAFLIGLLIFIGTVGKSAQFPLQVWLPDAMEGPTPVSALIHAATMVSAGIYLVVRMFPLMEFGGSLIIAAYVGAITAFFAAVLAIKQNDIKKVLAYSTLSQLGFMVMALGVGAHTAAFFHLITHAVFKACLFMASGAVIYAMHHEQDMRHMGGLKKKLPITFACMLITTMAIAGVPFFSGFASKDMILANVLGFGFFMHPEHLALPILGFSAAALTAFYMFRLIFMTFFGHPHDHHHYDEAHEVSWNMWLPLAVLAFFSFSFWYTGSLTGGLAGAADKVLGGANDWFVKLTQPPALKYREAMHADPHHSLAHFEHVAHIPAMVLSLIVAGCGIFFSYLVFGAHKIKAEKLAGLWPKFVHKAIDNLYFFDWFYIKVVIQKLLVPFAKKNAQFDDAVVDRVLVDGWKDITMVGQKASGLFDDVVVDGVMVDGLGGGIPTVFGSSLRSLQNGKVQRYLMVAVVALMLAFVFRGVI